MFWDVKNINVLTSINDEIRLEVNTTCSFCIFVYFRMKMFIIDDVLLLVITLRDTLNGKCNVVISLLTSLFCQGIFLEFFFKLSIL